MTTPDAIGPYRLLSRLGAGGFGEVHLALDSDGRTVAVKVLHPQVAADSSTLARLAREVETMRRVRGPHVAEVRDADLTGSRPYIVTRYVQGRPLHTVVAADGPVQGDDLVRLACGLARALQSIHAAGVVHRDLKPANVIIADGEPYVIDFGIACALDSASVTTTGAVIGTPGYLAPEVLEGGEAGPAADVFAWAATLAFAASGVQPYGSGPAPAVAYRVVHGEPDLSGVPSWLGPLLLECLRHDPAARPTAAELCAHLGVAAPLGPVPAPEGSELREAPTQRMRPRPARGRGVSEPHTRHRERLHRRWVLGSAMVVGLFAAAAEGYLPEVALLLLVLYGVAVLIDAGFSLLGRSRARVVTDLVGGVGVVGLWALLSSLFSSTTLLLAVGAVLFLLVGLVLAG